MILRHIRHTTLRQRHAAERQHYYALPFAMPPCQLIDFELSCRHFRQLFIFMPLCRHFRPRHCFCRLSSAFAAAEFSPCQRHDALFSFRLLRMLFDFTPLFSAPPLRDAVDYAMPLSMRCFAGFAAAACTPAPFIRCRFAITIDSPLMPLRRHFFLIDYFACTIYYFDFRFRFHAGFASRRRESRCCCRRCHYLFSIDAFSPLLITDYFLFSPRQPTPPLRHAASLFARRYLPFSFSFAASYASLLIAAVAMPPLMPLIIFATMTLMPPAPASFMPPLAPDCRIRRHIFAEPRFFDA